MLLVNVSGRFIIGIENVPDETPISPGIFDITGDSEVSYIGFSDTPDVNIGIFDIQATSMLAYIGESTTQPVVGIGNFTILGNSILNYIGSNSAHSVNGVFNITSRSTLAYIGEANQGGTIIKEGEFTILGQSILNMIGRNGAASEGPNDFFNELSELSTMSIAKSWRNQIQINADIEGGGTNVFDSTAANPTVVQANAQKFPIVSSLDGVVTLSTGGGLLGAGSLVQIVDHSLPALNGLKTIASKQSNTQYTISGISGSGVGGFLSIAGHVLFDNQVINMTGHVAIPNGLYAAELIDQYTFRIKTLGGSYVGSSGGNAVGTLSNRYVEYFPGSGRTDPFSDPQDAAKYTIPHYWGCKGRVNVVANFPQSGDASILAIADWYLCPNMKTGTATTVGEPIKCWRIRGPVVSTEGPKLAFKGRRLPIASTTAGATTTVRIGKSHYYTTGDQVVINGNVRITNGTYTVTVTSATQFTIPFTTSSNSTNSGTSEQTREVGRLICRSEMGNAGFMWNCGLVSIDSAAPPGPGAIGIGNYPVYDSVMNRWWIYFEPNLTGDSFTEWNESVVEPLFGTGHKIGKWNFLGAVNGSGVATLNCTDGPHGYQTGQKVTIAGISGLTGTYTIASIPATPTATSPSNGGFTGPSSFTVNGATPGANGSVTAAIHFTKFSWFWADENREPVKLIYSQPVKYDPTGYNFFRLEYDSSSDTPNTEAMDSYLRNGLVLRNPTNVTIANPVYFRKPVTT